MAADRAVKVLEAAALLLEQEGGRGFNTNALAERSGVPVGSFYKLFKDRDVVLVALLARELEGAFVQVNSNDDFRSGSARLLSALVARVRKRPKLAFELDYEERRLQSTTGPRALVRNTLGQCLRPGGRRVADPDISVIYLVELVTGMALAACEDIATQADSWAERRITAALSGYMEGGPYRTKL